EALAALTARGVTVKILTGDHPGTATRACRDLGIPLARTEPAGPTADVPGGPEPDAGAGRIDTLGAPEPDAPAVLTADHIDTLGAPELAQALRRTTVFARCTPAHKARIVHALRGAGHTVGFLGDGVNDLPALRSADVGIAPRGAADVVRDAADVVLADKDLTAVGHALAEGRRAGGNIVTYLRVTLSSNLGNVIAMLSAGLLLPFLPMLPAQVLVQNLCFDAAQLAFAHDRPPPSAVRGPRVLDPRELLRFIVGFGALNAVADLATFGVLAYALRGPGDTEEVFHSGWFTENLLTQALVMALLRFAGPGARRPGPVVLAALALAAVGLALPPSPLGAALGLTPLPAGYYPLLAAVLVLYAAALRMARTYAGRGM
ncbi:HAD-IC family P-type ATPase, partial [Streptomyces sp. NPDC047072]|uniref:HAD-IC family P-type ATPase n=1 Tax=Streptomyces sp. NPDC047072 TaxID=3154809 RepID=UPI0033C9543A